MSEYSRAPKRVLVSTKYRFIGDTLLAVPLLRAVHDMWPEAHVALLTGAKAHEVLDGCPYVSERIEFDPYRPADRGVFNYVRLIAQLRREPYDIALIGNRSFHSALIASMSGVRRRIGWEGFQGRDILLTDRVPYDADAPEVRSYLDLLTTPFPITHATSDLELWVRDDERDAVQGRLPSAPIVIGIQPGASHAIKRWPAASYANLMVRVFSELPGARFVLIGGPDERASGDELRAGCDHDIRRRTTDLVGQLSLRQTLAALTYCDLFVSGDTAIRHAATALGAPTVGLFGPTSAAKWGNARPPRDVVLWASSGRVDSIGVEEAVAAALAALEAGPDRVPLARGSGRVQV
jgi:heptosyltransferase-2